MSNKPFHYQHPFPLKKDDTEYYLLTSDYVSVAEFEGQEIVKVARQKILEIAFDADSFTNPHVARALASLLALRIREQQFLSCDKPTKILAWDSRFKGIDDALMAGASLKYLEVSDWLELLTPECLDEASHQLARILP